MNNPLIHIGYPKTATTWFQNELYPKIINKKFIKAEIFRSVVTNEIPFIYNPDKALVNNYFCNDPFIVCDEGIIGGNPFVAIESINRVHKLFPNSRVILFIRSQFDMISSKYSQYVYKNMGTMSANAFVSNDEHWHRVHNFQKFHPEYLCYDKVIEYLITLFGNENIFIYLYEDLLADPVDFIYKFLAEHNLEIKQQVSFIKHNEGLRKRLYPLVRFMNIFTRYKRRDKYYLIHIPYWFQFCRRFYKRLNSFRIFGEKPQIESLISKEKLRNLYALYKSSNNNLARFVSIEKLKKYNYPT
jgi:hypothetical protein